MIRTTRFKDLLEHSLISFFGYLIRENILKGKITKLEYDE